MERTTEAGRTADATGYRVDDLTIDLGRRRVTRGETVIPLAELSFDFLVALARAAPNLLTFDQLTERVWPGLVISPETISQRAKVVRDALGDDARSPRYIAGIRGRGYRMLATVTPLAASVPAISTTTQEREVHRILSLIGRKPWRWWAIGGVGVLLAGGILFVLTQRLASDRWSVQSPSAVQIPETSIVISPAIGKPRLAILPFENLSPDPVNAFFADGLHEEILSTIAQRVLGLEVISRTTMMSYRRDPPKPLAEVARELGASHLIEGSVRREANRVRLTLQLIDARTDVHLWSQNYDRTLTDALTLQSDVASEVASQLSLQLVGGPQSALPLTRSPEAYDLYLKEKLAERSLSFFDPVERYREVENLLNRAIALDPSFALAYAQRATLRGFMFEANYDVSEEWVRRIREDVDAGRRLAPHEPIVLAAAALYGSSIEGDLPRALAIFESVEMAGLADPMFLGGKSELLLRLGRVDEAVGLNERLMALDPGNPVIRSVVAGNLIYARRTAEALQFVKRFPDDASMRYTRALVIFANTGRTDEWRAALDQANETIGSPVTMLEQNFALLTIEHRYADAQKLLDDVSVTSTRVNPFGSGFFGVGERPIAEYRGWTALFLNQSASAATQGRAVLEFVAQQEETKWNAWFLQLLSAEGLTFLGQRERAIVAARKTLELMPPSRDALGWASAAGSAAAVYAWAGAQDEAVALLEELSTARPGLRPASITRNPIYATPLAQNPRYQALTRRLEEQMRETGLR